VGSNKPGWPLTQRLWCTACLQATSVYIKQPALTLRDLQTTLYDQLEVGYGRGVEFARRPLERLAVVSKRPLLLKCCVWPTGVHPTGSHGHVLAQAAGRGVCWRP
jgi:hypothetical protein